MYKFVKMFFQTKLSMIRILLLVTIAHLLKSESFYQPSHNFCNNLDAVNDSCINYSMYCSSYKPKGEIVGTGVSSAKETYLHARMKQIIVNKHNEIRNTFACGGVSNINGSSFPGAIQMAPIKWSVELEWSAAMLAKTCIHAKACPATDNFLNAGQNILMWKTNEQSDDLEILLNRMLMKWVTNILFLRPDHIERFQSRDKDINLTDIGHMISESNLYVGCHLASCGIVRDLFNYFLVCNYNSKVYENQTLYEVGKSHNNTHSKYRCLHPIDLKSGGQLWFLDITIKLLAVVAFVVN